MKKFRRSDDATPTGIDVGVGAAAIVAACLLATRIPRADLTWRCTLVAVVVGVVALCVGDAPAVAFLVPATWMLVNGFMENTLGQLSWHGAADVRLFTALGLAGCAGLVAARGNEFVEETRQRA